MENQKKGNAQTSQGEIYKKRITKEKFAYLGKGITYDTGGMNIKTGNFMRQIW